MVASPDVGFRQAGLQVRRDDARARSSSATRSAAATTRRPRCSTSSVEVEGKNVLIVDDFTISGGTLIEMADRLQGARCQGRLRLRLARRFLARARPPRSPQSPIKELVSPTRSSTGSSRSPPCCKVVSVAGSVRRRHHVDPPPRERQPAVQLLNAAVEPV